MKNKEKHIWLWILGWIFIFPVPMTILMLKNIRLEKKLRYGIIVIVWAVYLIIIGIAAIDREKSGNLSSETDLYSSNSNSSEDVLSDDFESAADVNNSTEDTEIDNKDKVIADLVENYNNLSDDDLEYIEDFVVSDKMSDHYRTEFRLNAFREALGKSYRVDDSIVDIISYEEMLTGVEVRVYADNVSFDLCIDLIKFMSSTLDEELSKGELDETINYITGTKTANGYYYGNLGLTLFGNDTDGYDLMIKTD